MDVDTFCDMITIYLYDRWCELSVFPIFHNTDTTSTPEEAADDIGIQANG